MLSLSLLMFQVMKRGTLFWLLFRSCSFTILAWWDRSLFTSACVTSMMTPTRSILICWSVCCRDVGNVSDAIKRSRSTSRRTKRNGFVAVDMKEKWSNPFPVAGHQHSTSRNKWLSLRISVLRIGSVTLSCKMLSWSAWVWLWYCQCEHSKAYKGKFTTETLSRADWELNIGERGVWCNPAWPSPP